MITYEKLCRQAVAFRCLTGLTVEAFEKLLPAFEQAYERMLDEEDGRRRIARQRQRGGGRKGILVSRADQLMFILVYFRLYPVQVLQGVLFGMGQPQANMWIQRLTPVLHEALGYEQQLPARQTKDINAVLSQCPGAAFIIDGTERPIRRPQSSERQRSHYSGKKKRHTVKNVVITDKASRKVKALSATAAGKTHDKRFSSWFSPKTVSSGRILAFRAMNPPTSPPFNRKRNPKVVN